MTVRARLVVLVAFLGSASPARARDLVDEEDFQLSFRSAFKSSLLLAFPPADDILYPDRPAGAGLFRLRFETSTSIGEHFSAAVVYEHRVRTASGDSVGLGVLPSTTPVPFRLEQASWPIIDDEPSYLHIHEFDRAWVALHFDFMELKVGRQAIGLGRGVLFSAVDVFAPFPPTEVDQEWRRGVDAAHLELKLPDFNALSADVYAALGQIQDDGSLATWALLGRLRALVGDVDASILVGRRGADNMVGGTLSAIIGDAETHGELAMFGTDGQGIDGGFMGTDAVVAKLLLGGSYNIAVGNGLRVLGEYHYSGFGVKNIGDDPSILNDPDWALRFSQGQSQILGRHALALSLSYDPFYDLTTTLSYIQSPVDASGMVAGTITWYQSNSVTIVFNAWVPWGTTPSGGVPRSEWGTYPITLFLQARFYD
jgi:hypothetical protein